MNIYTIDIRDVRTRSQLHEKIAEVLPLPDYYGSNLDALFDVLTEYVSQTKIIFLTNTDVEAALGKYYSALHAMCGAAAEEDPHLTIKFEAEDEFV